MMVGFLEKPTFFFLAGFGMIQQPFQTFSPHLDSAYVSATSCIHLAGVEANRDGHFPYC